MVKKGSLLIKCRLKQRIMNGREAERNLRYMVQRITKRMHKRTVTLPDQERRETDDL